MRRVAIAILLLCACIGGPDDVDRPSGSTSGTNGGSPTVGGGGAPFTDAGIQDVGDAGTPRSGSTFSPVVGADAGAMSLVVTPEPGSSCAGWLPKNTEPEMSTVRSDGRFSWSEPITNGRGDLAVPFEGTYVDVGFVVDGQLESQGPGDQIVPQSNGFLFVSTLQPCMICRPNLTSWPSGNQVALSRYPNKVCSFAPRPAGGAYTSCVGPPTDGGVPTFAKYDGSLNLESSGPGDSMDLVAADAQDRVIETDGSGRWRWLDSNGTVVSDFFPASSLPQHLIGGGFIDYDGRIIPSGSASTSPAPTWLTERNTVSIAFGGRGYALGDNDCGLVLRDARGALCGTLDFVNCRTPPRPGLDGTIALPLNTDGFVSEQDLAVWRGLLR